MFGHGDSLPSATHLLVRTLRRTYPVSGGESSVPLSGFAVLLSVLAEIRRNGLALVLDLAIRRPWRGPKSSMVSERKFNGAGNLACLLCSRTVATTLGNDGITFLRSPPAKTATRTHHHSPSVVQCWSMTGGNARIRKALQVEPAVSVFRCPHCALLKFPHPTSHVAGCQIGAAYRLTTSGFSGARLSRMAFKPNDIY